MDTPIIAHRAAAAKLATAPRMVRISDGVIVADHPQEVDWL